MAAKVTGISLRGWQNSLRHFRCHGLEPIATAQMSPARIRNRMAKLLMKCAIAELANVSHKAAWGSEDDWFCHQQPPARPETLTYPATSISSVLISGDSSRGAPSVTTTMSCRCQQGPMWGSRATTMPSSRTRSLDGTM